MRRRNFTQIALALAAMSLASPEGNAAVIHSRRVHLRSGDKPEWQEFAARTPDARRLDVNFTASSNQTEAALFIRQDDVRQDWAVELNGRRLGKLFTMEADLVHSL